VAANMLNYISGSGTILAGWRKRRITVAVPIFRRFAIFRQLMAPSAFEEAASDRSRGVTSS
jgi:hypothetical protein